MVTVNADLVAFVDPACQEAITIALHKVNPDNIHRRLNGECPLCPTISEAFADRFVSTANNPANEQLRERMKATVGRIMDAQDRQGNA